MWCNLPSPVPSRLSFSPLWITPLFYIAARPSPPPSPIPPHWPTFFSPGLFSQASAQHKAACTAQIWAGEKKKRKKKKWGNEWESGGKQEIRSKSGFSGTSPCCSWLLGGAESRSEATKQKNEFHITGWNHQICLWWAATTTHPSLSQSESEKQDKKPFIWFTLRRM